MRPGDAVSFTIGRQTASGAAAASGLTTSAFTVGSFLDGASSSISAAVTDISTSGNWRMYKFAATLPATPGMVAIKVQPSSGYDIISPDTFEFEVESYDIDALGGLFLTAQGQPGILSASDSDLGDIVDGDSYLSETITLPAAKLTPFSQSTIAGLTMEAAIMASPGTTSYPITCTVVSAPANTVTISWSTQQHPALSGTTQSATWFIDIQGIKAGPIIVTLGRYKFTQVWQRDTRTT